MANPIPIEILPRDQFRDYILDNSRWSVVVCHRRGGKTYSSLQKLVKRAVEDVRPGPPRRYAYIAPTREQAKDIAWSYLKAFIHQIPKVVVNESELKVTMPDKTTIRLYSGDTYDRMRGLYFDGVIIDEPEDIDPRAWPEVIRPCLTDYKGWAIWIGTVKGKKGQWKRYTEAKDLKGWFTMNLKASESGILPEDELKEIRMDPMMTEEAYRQEYENDPTVGILGAIYAKEMAIAESENRVINFNPDKGALVHTSWDIGSPENTSVVYFQRVGPFLYIIDHDKGLNLKTGERVAHMIAKGYNYGYHCLPHDAASKRPGGMSFIEELDSAGLKNCMVIPRTDDPERRINRMREMFGNIYFHKDKTERLRESLEAYQYKEEKTSATITSVIWHNWASHDADAFGYIAEAEASGIIETNLPRMVPANNKGSNPKVVVKVKHIEAEDLIDVDPGEAVRVSNSKITSYGKVRVTR